MTGRVHASALLKCDKFGRLNNSNGRVTLGHNEGEVGVTAEKIFLQTI